MSYERPKILIILGPTASGKSKLGVELARKFGGEIISADSRQVYRGMDIGTGKITRSEMRGVPHHLLDVALPKKTFTVAQYQKLGKTAIRKIVAKGKLPIVVGGTGFYIDALIYNYDLPHVKPNPKLRRALGKKSAEELFRELKHLDPRRASTVDQWNKRRLVRALEIVLTTGRPVPPPPQKIYSNILKNTRIDKSGVLKIGVKVDPEELKRKIHKRLLARLRRGMIGEVKKLREKKLSWQKLDNFGLEYRFVSRYLRGLISKEKMIELLDREIWKYSKRQMTWFKKDKKIHWIAANLGAENLIKKFLAK